MRTKATTAKLVGVALSIWPLMALSQDTVVSSSLNMGFGVSSAANTTVASAVGEVLIGSSAGENTRAQSGFLVMLLRQQTPVGVDEVDGLPIAYALHQNYPNPFNPSTTLRFDLPAGVDVRIVVYDLLGREVVQLVDQRLEAGYHQLVWNSRDRSGRELPTGMYIVLMVTPEYNKSIKMVLLK